MTMNAQPRSDSDWFELPPGELPAIPGRISAALKCGRGRPKAELAAVRGAESACPSGLLGALR